MPAESRAPYCCSSGHVAKILIFLDQILNFLNSSTASSSPDIETAARAVVGRRSSPRSPASRLKLLRWLWRATAAGLGHGGPPASRPLRGRRWAAAAVLGRRCRDRCEADGGLPLQSSARSAVGVATAATGRRSSPSPRPPASRPLRGMWLTGTAVGGPQQLSVSTQVRG